MDKGVLYTNKHYEGLNYRYNTKPKFKNRVILLILEA